MLFAWMILGLTIALKAQQYRVTPYNIEGGLAQSQVRSLFQDERGYIWMGTAGGGVSRFDGLKFQNYSIDQGLAGGEVPAIAQDNKGRIWFACDGAGISIYDGFKFKTIGPREGLKFNAAQILIAAHDGSMWLGTQGDGLFKIGNGIVTQYTKKQGLASDTVHSIVELPSGRMFIGTQRGISQIIDGEIKPLDNDYFNNQPTQTVGAMTLLHDGHLMGSQNQYVWKLVGFDFVYDTIHGSIQNINAIFEDSERQIWLAGEEMAARGKFKDFHRLEGKIGFKESGVNCFIEDKNNNVWMGSDYGGAFKFSLEAFSNYGEGTPFLDRSVFGLMEVAPNVIWVGTEKGLFELKDEKISLVKDFPDQNAFIFQMEKTPSGDIAIATSRQSYLYRDEKFVKILGDKNYSRRIRSVLSKTANGEPILSSATAMFRIEGDSAKPISFPGLDSIRGAFYYSESQNGEIWIATMYDGLYKLEGDHLRHFGLKEGLPSERILEVTRDHNDVLWLATYEGIARIKDDKICYFSHREGMLSSLVYLMLVDPQGDLWAGTSNGLSRIKLNEESEPISIQNYGATEGFTGIECNQNSRLLDSEGRLWFGTIGGLTVYDPARDLPDTLPPQIQLQNVLLNMEETNWKARENSLQPWTLIPINPVLAANENEVRIEFTAITHRKPEKMKYRFMLEGHQEDYGPYTTDKHANYPLLPPGKYTFKVHAINAEGIETKQPATFSFSVTAPWYKSIWFGVFLFGMLAFAVIGIIRIRTKTFQKQRMILEQKVKQRTEALELASRVKSEFLANMSHEIRTPMNGVIGMTDLLQRTPLSAQQRKFVENIRLSGHNLLALINDILDFSRIESGKMELEELPFELRHSMEEVLDTMAFSAFSKDLELLYWVDPEIRGPIIGDAVRLKQILINLIGNAIKFTSAGEITVKASLLKIEGDKAHIELSVKDTGIGIPKSKHKSLFESFTQVDASTTRKYGGTGLGLAISYNLAKIMGGDLRLESEANQGTEFFVTIVGGVSEPWKYAGDAHPASALKGKKVFVAVKNAASTKLISDYLQHWKLDCQCFSDLETATDAALDDQDADMILIDLRLVHGDPKVFANKFKDICTNRKLNFALLAEPDIALMLQNQVGERGWVISKPIKRDELLLTLSHHRTGASDIVFADEVELLAHRIPLNILVAEDNPINQDVALGMLESLGYQPQVAGNGKIALEKTLKGGIDLIFMDVQMPIMDGLEATRQIVAQIPKENRPLILAMTANAMQSDRENCLDAGMDSFISKPFLMDELRRVLSAVPAMRIGEKNDSKSKIEPPKPAVQEKKKKSESPDSFVTSMGMLEEVSGGDPAFIKGILKKMQVKLPEAIEELKAAAENQDWETVRATSHRSKSSAAYTGADLLKAKFMELEHIARDQNPLDEIPERIAALDDLVMRVVKEIKVHEKRY